jgi:hypothetical protein
MSVNAAATASVLRHPGADQRIAVGGAPVAASTAHALRRVAPAQPRPPGAAVFVSLGERVYPRLVGRVPGVAERGRTALNLGVLLASVEAAPPVAAADVLGIALTEALDARDVSFLIADYSGQSLIRLSHVVAATPTAPVASAPKQCP